MKREIKDIHFYQCPTTEIDVPRDTRVHHEPVMPIIPQNGDGFQESAEPISQGDKAKKSTQNCSNLYNCRIVHRFSIVWRLNNPELFEIIPSGKLWR